ncbi:MAG: hypothetical protein IPI51_14540 [Betaproteobacteria bacterium]|jgi:hypothetical protein|nr:hypothetical protein [Betaproteobacteria bacterium]MBK7275861.1 hypothetical protein [Betaproteobacteria bacterium]MBK7516792.1 hypothetical protein [Betaproteobacteria bacterium]MBP6463052.1 hypothetical protein [Rubrivivax sp.]
MTVRHLSAHIVAATCAALSAGALAQQPRQVVKPPVAQAWIDVATFGGMGMAMGLPGAGGGNPMAALGSLFGGSGGAGGNHFGQTQSMSPGRWVDVTLYTRNNPQLAEAQQSVPAGFLSPPLKLQSPKETRGTAPDPGDEGVTDEPTQERPKGKMLLYWGCGDKIRDGQPRVVDFATATPTELGRFFQSRRATQRGTHAAVGRPVWPSPADARLVPAQASLVGEHAFSGTGVPEGFRFQIGAAQDLMPPIALKQSPVAGSTLLEWPALPQARAYFIAGMGARENDEMVIWTSSEQPDIGFGLLDYQTNAAVDRWLKEKVLLTPQTTRCAVPAGVFPGEGAMLRMVAYGNELNLAHPPRPTDPRVPWEPVWAAKVRVKSVTMAMLGMEMPAAGPAAAEKPAEETQVPNVKDVLRGIFGR